MSRVYTERSIRLAVGTASLYCSSFLLALPQTRIAYGPLPNPGTSLIDLFLNLFDTSDPYLPAEVEIFKRWVVSEVFPQGQDSKLHAISNEFKARFPPPSAWVKKKLKEAPEFFEPLKQNSPRIYLRSYHRKRL